MTKNNQEYSKIFNFIFTLSWILLILTLFSKGIYTTCETWWIWCIIPTPHYRGTLPWYLALFSSIIYIILIFLKKNKLIKNYTYLWKYILVLWILSRILTILLSNDFKLYIISTWYKDNKWIVTSVDKYFKVLEDKCLKSNNKVQEICSWEIIEKFKNIDDYIAVLEYTKKNKLFDIYDTTYRSIVYWWSDWWTYNEENIIDMIKKYKDKTFQQKLLVDYLFMDYSDLTAVNLLIEYSDYEDIKEIAKFYSDKFNDLENKKNSINIDEFENTINSIMQELEFKARKINWVDHYLVKYTQPTIESFINELNNAFSSNNYSVCYDIIREANALHEPWSISYSVINETFTIKELIREYKDKTFQVALILNTFNLNYFNLLKENAVDEDISKIADDWRKIIMTDSINDSYEKWKEYLNKLDIQNIKWINNNFFINEKKNN